MKNERHNHTPRSIFKEENECLLSAQCYEPNMQEYYEWQNEENNKQHNIEKVHVRANAKTRNNDDDFKHIIKHALSCTLERNDEDVSSVSELRFGTMRMCRVQVN